MIFGLAVGSGLVRVVLASASPARLAVLRGAGLEPDVVVSGVDESAYLAGSTRELVGVLAAAKASAVAGGVASGIVVGCDSMLDLEGRAYGKPADAADAEARWREMSGKSGTLYTGHCVIDASSGKRAEGVAATTVRFSRPTDAEISAYVGTGEPLSMAGAFTIEGLGGWFVDSIDGDHNNVIGISLPLLRHLFADLGVSVPALWGSTTQSSA
ncbi:MAG: septum formation inhibitor Maf [Nocardiopsaceae bacterium]|nr:septum formation inhibitor Maf [Nocardiopsaceae bacterium]